MNVFDMPSISQCSVVSQHHPGMSSSRVSELVFTQLSAQALIYYETQTIPALNHTYTDVTMGLSAQTISEDLRAQVQHCPGDRIFLIFFNGSRAGQMMAASHGTYYSQSDIDWRKANPLDTMANPPSLSPQTCLQSTDSLVQQACQTLYTEANQSWAFHMGTQDMVLNGTAYQPGGCSLGAPVLGLACLQFLICTSLHSLIRLALHSLRLILIDDRLFAQSHSPGTNTTPLHPS